jgi:hypothetical protein
MFLFLPHGSCESALICNAFQSDCTNRRLNPIFNPSPRLIGRCDRGRPSVGFWTATRTGYANAAVACLQQPSHITTMTLGGDQQRWSRRRFLRQRPTARGRGRVLSIAAVRCATRTGAWASPTTRPLPCLNDGRTCANRTWARCSSTTATQYPCRRWRLSLTSCLVEISCALSRHMHCPASGPHKPPIIP